jgi:hypothetical protein
LKRDKLPVPYVVATLGSLFLFEALPYLEELWRGLRANPGRLVPPWPPARQRPAALIY